VAVAISRTVEQIFANSDGSSCIVILNYLDAKHVGYDHTTSIDVLTFTEGLRTAGNAASDVGMIRMGYYGFFSEMTKAQKITYVLWAADKLISAIPPAYPRLAAIQQVRIDVGDYLVAPTTPKRNALLTKMRAIHLDQSEPKEMIFAHAFKIILARVILDTYPETSMRNIDRAVIRSGDIDGVGRLVKVNESLTKLQEIIGVRHP